MKALVSFCVALAAVLASCTPDPTSPTPRSAPSPEASAEAPAEPSFDGWHVDVAVSPARVGPVDISVAKLSSAPKNNAEPWIQHVLIVRNRSGRMVDFDDTRTSKFLFMGKKPVLLAADEGCGYGIPSPNAPIEPGACATYLDLYEVKPHGKETREITISKGLNGMSAMRAGTYVFRKVMRFHSGGRTRTFRLALTYEVTPAV